MPIPPWKLPPKQALGIFSGLGQVLDARQARADAAAAKQQSIEDRVFGNIRQAKKDVEEEQSRSLEDALKQAQARALGVKEVDPTKDLYDLSGGAPVLRQRAAPKLTESEPMEVVVGEDGKRTYVPRSKAAGMEAPSPAPADDKALVPVQQEDGTVVYVPRTQAAGKNAPSRQGVNGATKAQRVQALANMSDAIDNYQNELDAHGPSLVPSADQASLKTAYTNALMQAKEMYNLGVLNGKDLNVIQSVLSDPTSVVERAKSFGSAGIEKGRHTAQIAQVRKILDRYKANLAEGNNAITSPGGDQKAVGDVMQKYGLTPPPRRKP